MFQDSEEEGGLSKRPRCQQKVQLWFLREGKYVPMLVQVPITSAKAYKNFVGRLSADGYHYQDVLVELGLKKEKSRDGIEYSEITFSVGKGEDGKAIFLNVAQADALEGYSKAFENTIKTSDVGVTDTGGYMDPDKQPSN
jgi:hypothetical protein